MERWAGWFKIILDLSAHTYYKTKRHKVCIGVSIICWAININTIVYSRPQTSEIVCHVFDVV